MIGSHLLYDYYGQDGFINGIYLKGMRKELLSFMDSLNCRFSTLTVLNLIARR